MNNLVSDVMRVPPANADDASRHFNDKFRFETDCADVHTAMATKQMDFVLLDVRGKMSFEREHIAGAINLLRSEMTPERLAQFPSGSKFVVYCAGTHCNGADKAAARIAELGLPVKVMVGGIEGWRDEGYRFAGQLSERKTPA